MIKDTLGRAFQAIEGERDYQDKTWPNANVLPMTGEILLLERYLNEFKEHYAVDNNNERCLHDIRKMATILIRCMVNNGIRFR